MLKSRLVYDFLSGCNEKWKSQGARAQEQSISVSSGKSRCDSCLLGRGTENQDAWAPAITCKSLACFSTIARALRSFEALRVCRMPVDMAR